MADSLSPETCHSSQGLGPVRVGQRGVCGKARCARAWVSGEFRPDLTGRSRLSSGALGGLPARQTKEERMGEGGERAPEP